MEEKNIYNISVPTAIIIAGIFISLAIIISNNSGQEAVADSVANVAEVTEVNLRAVVADEHVRGDISAPVKLIQYSDPECPFCKKYHETIKEVVSGYDAGQVAWIYRSFPLDNLHKKSRRESEALECASAIGGNGVFWSYLDKLMEVTPSNDQLDPKQLDVIAKAVGLDAKKFSDCLASGKYAGKVQADVDDATLAGAQGTPYVVIISADGKKYPVDGAVSAETLKEILDSALRGS